jgi:hypothetical protein
VRAIKQPTSCTTKPNQTKPNQTKPNKPNHTHETKTQIKQVSIDLGNCMVLLGRFSDASRGPASDKFHANYTGLYVPAAQ